MDQDQGLIIKRNVRFKTQIQKGDIVNLEANVSMSQ